MKLNQLKQKHSRFIYKSYHYQFKKNQLTVEFEFKLLPDIEFHPKLIIDHLPEENWTNLSQKLKHTLIFNLGLAEIPSYWKAACSPEIEIQPHQLSYSQQNWWKKLLIKGLGEFYFQNQVDFTREDLVTFIHDKKAKPLTKLEPIESNYEKEFLLPIGGGKDSSLLLALLEEQGLDYGCLLLEPQSPAAQEIAQISSCQETIKVKRTIDPQLLKLNKQGYLNGHTPFSAYLSFLSTFIAHLFNYQKILVGNERSANQPNLRYLGQGINHQYSKSFTYEQDFREYANRYLGASPAGTNHSAQAEYLSALRPLYELQIASLFSKFDRYHSSFKSCNVSQKENKWCHHCPKCLFVFTLLYPFVDQETLTSSVFSHNLFEDEDLSETALALTGQTDKKPFECVGTFEETQVAFYLSVQKHLEKNRQLPPVLDLIQNKLLESRSEQYWQKQTEEILTAWNPDHNLDKQLVTLIKTYI